MECGSNRDWVTSLVINALLIDSEGHEVWVELFRVASSGNSFVDLLGLGRDSTRGLRTDVHGLLQIKLTVVDWLRVVLLKGGRLKSLGVGKKERLEDEHECVKRESLT